MLTLPMREAAGRKLLTKMATFRLKTDFFSSFFLPLNSELSREATVTPMPMESWSRLNTLLEKTDSAS